METVWENLRKNFKNFEFNLVKFMKRLRGEIWKKIHGNFRNSFGKIFDHTGDQKVLPTKILKFY